MITIFDKHKFLDYLLRYTIVSLIVYLSPLIILLILFGIKSVAYKENITYYSNYLIIIVPIIFCTALFITSLQFSSTKWSKINKYSSFIYHFILIYYISNTTLYAYTLTLGFYNGIKGFIIGSLLSNAIAFFSACFFSFGLYFINKKKDLKVSYIFTYCFLLIMFPFSFIFFTKNLTNRGVEGIISGYIFLSIVSIVFSIIISVIYLLKDKKHNYLPH